MISWWANTTWAENRQQAIQGMTVRTILDRLHFKGLADHLSQADGDRTALSGAKLPRSVDAIYILALPKLIQSGRTAPPAL